MWAYSRRMSYLDKLCGPSSRAKVFSVDVDFPVLYEAFPHHEPTLSHMNNTANFAIPGSVCRMFYFCVCSSSIFLSILSNCAASSSHPAELARKE